MTSYMHACGRARTMSYSACTPIHGAPQMTTLSSEAPHKTTSASTGCPATARHEWLHACIHVMSALSCMRTPMQAHVNTSTGDHLFKGHLRKNFYLNGTPSVQKVYAAAARREKSEQRGACSICTPIESSSRLNWFRAAGEGHTPRHDETPL